MLLIGGVLVLALLEHVAALSRSPIADPAADPSMASSV
jgi:hypothetical protein